MNDTLIPETEENDVAFSPHAQGNADATAEIFYRAYETRDPRFDGRFFVAVRTTKIFCRPICPARTPKRSNVRFYTSAAAAFAAGYRPCLRCRPERAPSMRGQENLGAALVARALDAIDAGALNEGSIETLSERIGVSSRHLRRLFDEHLGASPVAVAQTRRLLFAKQLIEGSTLPLTQVAFAAGFASVRRFNAAVAKTWGRPPGSLRKRNPTETSATVDRFMRFHFCQLDANGFVALLDFYRARIFAGVESVSASEYSRSICLGGTTGILAVQGAKDGLLLATDFPHAKALPAIVARTRRMFDIDAPTAVIREHLQHDCKLQPALKQSAMAVPCAWDAYELAVRAVLGQQISVAGATTLAGRLAAKFGQPLAVPEPYSQHLKLAFPAVETLAEATIDDLRAIGLVRTRAETVIALARHVATNPAWRERYAGQNDFVAEFCELPGIGPWTAQYVAMRGFRDPDAFPAADLGLLRTARALGIAQTSRQLQAHAERWRPWRAYAAQTLWNFDHGKSA